MFFFCRPEKPNRKLARIVVSILLILIFQIPCFAVETIFFTPPKNIDLNPSSISGSIDEPLLIARKRTRKRSRRTTRKRKRTRSKTRSRSRSRRKKRSRKRSRRRKKRTRYAYPYSFFMLKAPSFDTRLLPQDEARAIKSKFDLGQAAEYTPSLLVRAGIVKYFPMKGGIFHRREPVKYIIMHSTETGRPAGAKRVIMSWGNRGRRHPGAQYVVDRDGTIYQAVDPTLGTVHVNIFKTLKGINNDNSIGIEMVHSGKQTYTGSQLNSVVKLVGYLQERFNIKDKNIITHRYAQQGHHTDPVNFDWNTFIARTKGLRKNMLLARSKDIVEMAQSWNEKLVEKSADNDMNKTIPEPEKTFEKETIKNSTEKSVSFTVDSKIIPKPAELKNIKLPELRGPIEVGPEHTQKILDILDSE